MSLNFIDHNRRNIVQTCTTSWLSYVKFILVLLQYVYIDDDVSSLSNIRGALDMNTIIESVREHKWGHYVFQ